MLDKTLNSADAYIWAKTCRKADANATHATLMEGTILELEQQLAWGANKKTNLLIASLN